MPPLSTFQLSRFRVLGQGKGLQSEAEAILAEVSADGR
jgi:hypothetical protein